MKRLIVCCDGTWNTPDQDEFELPSPTNVIRLRNALALSDDAKREQRIYYHTGVGTEGTFFQRNAGGMYGAGLGRNIMSAYAWLGVNYEPGDLVYLFGFSRGAFTVRSLGGLLNHAGLLDLRGLSPAEKWARVEAVYDKAYRDHKKDWSDPSWAFFHQSAAPVAFIGVWDTVGALGIPDDLAFLNLLDRPQDWRFHDTSLGDNIAVARHAIALDEQRASFSPTLWTEPNSDIPLPNSPRVQQIWFPGVHSDVGGGYLASGLADIALKWMIDEAASTGLAFNPAMVAQIKPDARAPKHDSVRGFFKLLRTRPRAIPLFEASSLHPSAIDRHRNPPISEAPYHPTIRLAPGEGTTHSVYAAQHWNALGIYLEAGATYRFRAEGEWIDRDIPCGPKGMRDGKFHPGEIAHIIGNVTGKLEEMFRKLTKNPQADFWGTRRVEKMPWFSLVGVIANDGPLTGESVLNDGSASAHQVFLIGEGCEIEVEEPGYLYAFANDAWTFYGNNHGSVTLTVARV